MTNQQPVAKHRPKKAVMLTGAALALIVVVYFVFFFPPTPAEDARGAIGAAEKYRSEQITDSDVILGEYSTAGSEIDFSDLANAETMGELQRAAASFAATVKVLERQASLDKAAVAEFQRAAAALERTAKYARTAALSRAFAVEVMQRTQSAEKNALDAMAKPSLDRAAVADLQRTAQALSLQATAANLAMAARSLEKQQSLDRAASSELQRTAATLMKTASFNRTAALERTAAVADLLERAEALERNAVAGIDKPWRGGRDEHARLMRTANSLDRQAATLNRAAAARLEKNAALQKAQSAGNQ